MTFLKPLSSAIAIGTGGPFGAEGPIIATGGALGSADRPVDSYDANERKTLLAAGAAAGMTATFSTPDRGDADRDRVAAVRVSRAFDRTCALAARRGRRRMGIEVRGGVRDAGPLGAPSGWSSIVAILAGGLIGVASCYITRVGLLDRGHVRAPADPLDVVAGAGRDCRRRRGLLRAATLGVGYDNIEGALAGSFGLAALAALCAARPAVPGDGRADHAGRREAGPRGLRHGHDLVIVDCTSWFNETTLAILDAADTILTMLSLEITSIKNMRLFLEVAEQLGYEPDKVKLVLNRADSSLGIRVSDVESSIGRKVDHTIVSDGRSSCMPSIGAYRSSSPTGRRRSPRTSSGWPRRSPASGFGAREDARKTAPKKSLFSFR